MKVDCGYTENYLKEKKRMTKNCDIACEDCPISNDNNKTDLPCEEFENTYPNKAIEIVQGWSDEHQQETRTEHFLKMHPKARMRSGHPNACVKDLNNNVSCEVCLIGCKKCWDKPYKDDEF